MQNENAKHSEQASQKGKSRAGIAPREGSAVEKRRTQVRNAQRAYRNRKDAEVQSQHQRLSELRNSSLEVQSEIEHLLRLSKNVIAPQSVEELSNQIEDLAVKQKRILHMLNEIVKPVSEGREGLKIVFDARSSTGDQSGSQESVTKAVNREEALSEDLTETFIDRAMSTNTSIVSNAEMVSTEDLQTMSNQDLSTTVSQLSSLVPTGTISTAESFSAELHLKALQRSHQLITSAVSPSSLLEQTFPACTPPCHKQLILDAIQYLWSSFQSSGASDMSILQTSGFITYSRSEPDTKRMLLQISFLNQFSVPRGVGLALESTDDLLFPEEIEQYLRKSGIELVPNGSFALATRPAVESVGRSGFIPRRRQPRSEFVTLSKLYEDLLESVMFLCPAGPAFWRSGVDRVIEQVTVVQ